jgi:hypothetical protein
VRGPGRYQTLDQDRDPGGDPGVERPELRRDDLKLIHSQATTGHDEERVPDAPTAKEARDYEAEWEAKLAAKQQELDALVASQKINQSERTRRLAVFDNQHLVEMKQRDLQEAREIAAEARARAAAAQERQLERDGRQR